MCNADVQQDHNNWCYHDVIKGYVHTPIDSKKKKKSVKIVIALLVFCAVMLFSSVLHRNCCTVIKKHLLNTHHSPRCRNKERMPRSRESRGLKDSE